MANWHYWIILSISTSDKSTMQLKDASAGNRTEGVRVGMIYSKPPKKIAKSNPPTTGVDESLVYCYIFFWKVVTWTPSIFWEFDKFDTLATWLGVTPWKPSIPGWIESTEACKPHWYDQKTQLQLGCHICLYICLVRLDIVIVRFLGWASEIMITTKLGWFFNRIFLMG